MSPLHVGNDEDDEELEGERERERESRRRRKEETYSENTSDGPPAAVGNSESAK